VLDIAIDGLRELGIVTSRFAERFRGVAGFRNILVHGYLGTDPERLHDMLNSGLDDFVEFAQHVETYLQRSSA
jgi:uncharacterized protein YutE (UPF0331/DUF86 family)